MKTKEEQAQETADNVLIQMAEKQNEKLGKTVEGKPRKQAVSITYTLKAFGQNIDKLKEAGLIDDEQDVKLHEIRKNIVRTWTEQQFM